MKALKFFIINLLLVCFFITFPLFSKAQVDCTDPANASDPSCLPEGAGGAPASDVPFDGGVYLLVAIGIGFGIKKIIVSKKVVLGN